GSGVVGAPPLNAANQAPLYVISNPTGCSAGFGFVGGIIHGGPRTVPNYGSFNNGYIFAASESSNAIETYDAVGAVPGPITECPLSYETSPYLISPSGPSANGGLLPVLHARLFNANGNTVTRSYFNGAYTPPGAGDVWSVGANTQGTALDMSQPGGDLWVTTSQGGIGAVYLCTGVNTGSFPTGCPTSPTIGGLSYPVFPKAAANRLFVPDQNLGTVIEYQESTALQKATFINLASPWDVAGV
ncbi:MAG: hypothetical protein JO043_11410, partial [Candidatus Eremiobacteraeota bacterium]|nr:hypothetical protein [Candidatus Eremiobacteraeota bacterium]